MQDLMNQKVVHIRDSDAMLISAENCLNCSKFCLERVSMMTRNAAAGPKACGGIFNIRPLLEVGVK